MPACGAQGVRRAMKGFTRSIHHAPALSGDWTRDAAAQIADKGDVSLYIPSTPPRLGFSSVVSMPMCRRLVSNTTCSTSSICLASHGPRWCQQGLSATLRAVELALRSARRRPLLFCMPRLKLTCTFAGICCVARHDASIRRVWQLPTWIATLLTTSLAVAGRASSARS